MNHDMSYRPLISIITINYNNASGLDKTLASVDCQCCNDFEHIVVDGGSTDGSVDIIRKYENKSHRVWVSEKDNGIYDAMNKGIRMANGKYLQFLNSGDYLIDKDVIYQIMFALKKRNYPSILYGNLITITKKGRLIRNKNANGRIITPWIMYHGALTHASAFIKRDLFDRFGYYNENLKIVSDWEWYFKVIYYGGIQPHYVDIDVTFFNLMGISETNYELNAKERRQVIEGIFPKPFLQDYDSWSEILLQQGIIKRHGFAIKIQKILLSMARFIERIQSRWQSYVLRKELKRKGISLR